MATAKSSTAGPMNRGDVAGAIAAKHNLSQVQADAITKDYEAAIVRALSSGQEVRLAGFGSFKVAKRAARTGRNPRTGEATKVAAKTVMRFAPGKAVKDAVNGVKAGASTSKAGAAGGAKAGGVKAGAAATAKTAAKPAAKTAAPSKAAAAKGGKKK